MRQPSSKQYPQMLYGKKSRVLTDENFIIGDNPMETFSHVDWVLALFNDIHLMENPDRPEKFTYEGHAGYWICIHSLRSAIKAQVDHMNTMAKKKEGES